MTSQTQNQFSMVHSRGRAGPDIPNTVAWDVDPDLARRLVGAARMARNIPPSHSIVFSGPDSTWLLSPREPPIEVRQVEIAVSARDYWLEAALDDGSVVTSSRISVLETAEVFGLLTKGLQQVEELQHGSRSTNGSHRRLDARPERGQREKRHHRRADRSNQPQRSAVRR